MLPERWRQIKKILDSTLEHSPKSRGAFLNSVCAGDAELRREIESLLEFEDAETDFIGESVFELTDNLFDTDAKSFIGKNFGNYKIAHEIGAGGMGAVFLATRTDGEFTQRVAVKLIKRGINSDIVRRRFYRERQILASLEHPNIARLIDGGTTADGLPFLVMEYVEGVPITDYAAKNNLTLTERLDLFREVCAAVSYAHRNLVVHRDLKPSNILVAKDGTPKLLDFGIAKILNDERTNETQTHTFVFTPEYASPEQLRGEVLTTSTDIYSLGAILYELLTDSRPFAFADKNFGEIIITVSQTEPAKPSDANNLDREKRKRGKEEKNPELRKRGKIKKDNRASIISSSPLLLFSSSQLKGDLDNIVLKALKRDSERRYSSVEQFAEDIRRHLKGLPVSARQDTLAYRAEKFTRRNPFVVGAVAVAFLILIGGILATTYQARQANVEREKAERRFKDVRALANSFMFEINEKIEESPIKARELLVKRAEEYLNKLAAESGDDIGLQSELAASYQKIGDVQSELYRSNIGDTQGARENYAKALKIHEALYLAEPKNSSAGLNLSASCLKMGEISAKSGNITAALENFTRAVSLNEEFVSIEPQNLQARRQLSESLLKLGQAVFRTGNLSEVSAIYRRSLSIYETLAAENPADPKLQRTPAVLMAYIGFVSGEMGDHAAALNSYRQSLQISERILQIEPDNLQARRDRREFYHWLGIEYKNLGDNAASLAHHQKSQSITRELLRRDETDVQERNTLADSQMETAKTLAQSGRTADALTSFNEAIRNYEQVQKSDEKNAHVRCQIFYTKLYLADALARSGKTGEALENYEKSLSVFKELTAGDPNNSEWQNYLALCHLRIGEVFLGTNDRTKAFEYLEQALPIYEKLVAQSPENAKCRSDLETIKNHLGKLKNKEIARETH